MKRLAAFLLCLALAGTANAQRERLDELQSAAQDYNLDLEWQPAQLRLVLSALAAGNRGAAPALEGDIPGAVVRLDTRDYQDRRARIYITLPTQTRGLDAGTDLELFWQSSGEVIEGSVRPGQSALLYEGRVEKPVTLFTLNLRLVVGDSIRSRQFVLEPFYEIELLP